MRVRRLFWYGMTTVAVLGGITWVVSGRFQDEGQKSSLNAIDGISDLLVGEWKWTKTYDPFQGGMYSYPDQDEIWTFHESGRYEISGPNRNELGNWKIRSSIDGLSLFLHQAHLSDSRKKAGTRYEIHQIKDHKLIFAIQGRHGMVLYYYEALS